MSLNLESLHCAGGRKLGTLVGRTFRGGPPSKCATCRLNFVLKPRVGSTKHVRDTSTTLGLLLTSSSARTALYTYGLGRAGFTEGTRASATFGRTRRVVGGSKVFSSRGSKTVIMDNGN